MAAPADTFAFFADDGCDCELGKARFFPALPVLGEVAYGSRVLGLARPGSAAIGDWLTPVLAWGCAAAGVRPTLGRGGRFPAACAPAPVPRPTTRTPSGDRFSALPAAAVEGGWSGGDGPRVGGEILALRPVAAGVLRRSTLGRPPALLTAAIEILRRPLELLPPGLLLSLPFREKTCGNTEPVVSTAAPKLAPSEEAEECAGE